MGYYSHDHYRVENCNTVEKINEALQFYKNTDPDTFFRYKIPILNRVKALEQKRVRLLYRDIEKVPLSTLPPYSTDRLTCYYKATELIPILLDKGNASDHPEELTQLMGCFIGALKAAGDTWKPFDFTNEIQFYNCGPYKEKVMYLLHSMITSGFRHPKEIKIQINLYIKLLRQLELKQNIGFSLPNYHRESFVEVTVDDIKDFTY